jgi:DNA polymerase
MPTYKTNLVKCLPLDEKCRLRYPHTDEINACIGNLDSEIERFSPQAVFLLGNKVANAVAQHYKISFDKWTEYDFNPKYHNGIYFVPIQHPSYVHIYKRKTITDYVEAIVKIINSIKEKFEEADIVRA